MLSWKLTSIFIGALGSFPRAWGEAVISNDTNDLANQDPRPNSVLELSATTAVADAVTLAMNQAKYNREVEYGPLHVMQALCSQQFKQGHDLIQHIGGDADKLHALVTGDLKLIDFGGSLYPPYPAPDMLTLYKNLCKLAKHYNDKYIRLEYLLLGLLGHPSIAPLAKKSNLKFSKLHEMIKIGIAKVAEAQNRLVTDDSPTPTTLMQFSTELTDKEVAKQFNIYVGGDNLIYNLGEALNKARRSNALLIGLPGTGKTSFVEGLAAKIVEGNIIPDMKDIRIFALDMAKVISQSGQRGELEKKLTRIIDEVKDRKKWYIFIDEVHKYLCVSKPDGGPEVGNLLKRALSNGEIKIIGATTPSEFSKYIYPDKALLRRFETVTVEEPSEEDTITILRGVKQQFEALHKVRITDEAIVAAVDLAGDYIQDRRRPDSCIDLLDRGCARIRIQQGTTPQPIDILQRNLERWRVNAETLRAAYSPSALSQLKEIEEKIENGDKELATLRIAFESERKAVQMITQQRSQLDEAEKALKQAKRLGAVTDIKTIETKIIPHLKSKLIRMEFEVDQFRNSRGGSLYKDEVDKDTLESIIETLTGIPIRRLSGAGAEGLLHLAERIKAKIIGQPLAVSNVADQLLVASQLRLNKRAPKCSFLFMGPSGTGKTEMARTIAEVLYGSPDRMLRFDMSEYPDAVSVNRLIGSSPGYVGFEEGGQLTEGVRKTPNTLLLFDEVEKAHPNSHNIFLHMLESGIVTDGKSNPTYFNGTTIVCTTNAGASEFNGLDPDNPHDNERLVEARANAENALKGIMKREIINRFGCITVFDPLTRKSVKNILRKQIAEVVDNLKRTHNVDLQLTEKALEFILDLVKKDKGVQAGPDMGARPINRIVNLNLAHDLSTILIHVNNASVSIKIVEKHNPKQRHQYLQAKVFFKDVNTGEITNPNNPRIFVMHKLQPKALSKPM